ncbi:MAG: UDP-N-acetylmuramoyl-L-alanyl-D-glutamate--2,6-diaminopimelate ligase [bacterium]|mgnify:CR=1 FL=1|nr:UDP-N-acetylmuramoyl-L-alanyl-D-glutamate--2,6-diaminopimelate ligase [bacterium]
MIPVNHKVSISIRDLNKIIEGKILESNQSKIDFSVSGASCRSEEVDSNTAFVAISGVKNDGHIYIKDTILRGCKVCIVEDQSKVPKELIGILVKDTRKSFSLLSQFFMTNPSRELSVIGITGTNGKTTINWLLFNLLNRIGLSCSFLGTLGYQVGDIRGDLGLTTPDALSIQQLLRLSVEKGLKASVLEVSSHALTQARVSEIDFDIAIYTNLTRDHLDYHGSFEEYREAKWKLFEILTKSSKSKTAAIINIDCETGREYFRRLSGKSLELVSYGKESNARIQILDMSQDFKGSTVNFKIDGESVKISSPFIGFHNAQNLAAVLGVALVNNFDFKNITEILRTAPHVPGRLQSIPISSKFGIFVDYAHTPDALENVLKTLRPLVKNHLKVMFGCGGDRDKGKRPIMRKVSTKLADFVYLTSDNPRTEKAEMILADILKDASDTELAQISVEVDRKEAILRAIKELLEGDVLLVAGKGHEDYQIIGTTKQPFSDQDEILIAWEKVKKTNISNC